MKVLAVVLGVAIIFGGPLLSSYLFAGCPAIPNAVLGCSFAYPFGFSLICGSIAVGAIVAVWGLFRRVQTVSIV